MKKIFFVCLLAALLAPTFALAQNESPKSNLETFEARVLQILDQRTLTREDGSKNIQQNLRLKGLDGNWDGKEFTVEGIGEADIIDTLTYKRGDRVLVNHDIDIEGNDQFYIIDYVRRESLYWLAGIFALLILVIGRWKGAKSLFSLVVSFLVIMKFIVPLILSGQNPLLIGIAGSLIILGCVIYLTEGWRHSSHLAVISIIISLIVTYVLSELWVGAARLSGISEEAASLIGLGKTSINFSGLLLTSIIIGTLGVLDDVVISQIEAVQQIKSANPALSKLEIFKMAFEIGNAHLGAVVNTLFLAYAGASLPILLLFSVDIPPFLTFRQVINNEMIATEIIRTLVGSIGLALAVPLTTALATYFLSGDKPQHSHAH